MSIDSLVREMIAAPPARGRRRSRSLAVHDTAPLTEADIQMLHERPEGASNIRPLLRIRHSHHMMAQLLTKGIKSVEVSAITGYSQAYISTIQRDPAFKALMDFYAEQAQEINADMHRAMAAFGLDALGELSERLHESPDDFSVRELIESVTFVADRTGHGPASKNTQVNVNVNMAEMLKAAREREQEMRKPPLLEEKANAAEEG